MPYFPPAAASPPFTDTNTLIKGSADTTKLLRFEVDGFTTGTTRVLTPPNADATIAGLEVANVFTAIQKINVNNALALLVEQDGVKDNVLIVDTANGRVGILTAPATYNFEVIGITDAATAIFNSSSSSVGTRVVVQGTAANSNADNTDPALSIRNRSGTQVACIREDGLIASSFIGTLDNAAAFVVDSSQAAANYPRGLNLGDTAILGWAAGSWFNAKDITLSRTNIGQLNILSADAVTNSIVNTITFAHNSSGTPAAGFGSAITMLGKSSTTTNQLMGRLSWEWATATHASRAARGKLTAYDTAERECVRFEASGTAPMIGFYGTAAVAQQTVTGSRGGNAALADLLTKLATLGLIIDGSSA